MPTKSKPNPNEFFICIESFAGNEFAVAEGTVLPVEDERVQRCPDRFVALGTADEEVRRLKAANAAPSPPPEPLGRVKLRVLPGQGGLSAIEGTAADGVPSRPRVRLRGDARGRGRQCPVSSRRGLLRDRQAFAAKEANPALGRGRGVGS